MTAQISQSIGLRSGLVGGHKLGAGMFGVSWRISSTVARAPVHYPAGTKLLPDTVHIAGSSMTSLWRREAALKKSVRDITIISCFVTTINLPHALQIYSTVFLWRSVCGCIFQGSAATNCRRSGKFSCVFGQIISVWNSERIIEIGQYLPKLCWNEKGSSFVDSHSVVIIFCQNINQRWSFRADIGNWWQKYCSGLTLSFQQQIQMCVCASVQQVCSGGRGWI